MMYTIYALLQKQNKGKLSQDQDLKLSFLK